MCYMKVKFGRTSSKCFSSQLSVTQWYYVHLMLSLAVSGISGAKQQRVILMSLDGFRWDFQHKTKMRNLDDFVQNGVTVDYVRNVFPTNTVPNHQSIVTGLYPENHGMIDNRMFNETDGTIFIFEENTNPRWWNQSEPIWITNQKQGFRSGVIFWPGYNVVFDKDTVPKYLPDNDYTAPFAHEGKHMPLNDSIDMAVKWIKEDRNLTFVAIYSVEPDATAHKHSPDSNRTKNENLLVSALSKVDNTIGYLRKKIKDAGLEEETNIIFIGMISMIC